MAYTLSIALLLSGAAWAQGAPPAAVAPAAAVAPTPAVPNASAAGTAPAAPVPDPVADEASSYAIGLNFGTQLRSGGVDRAVLMDPLMKGIKEAMAGKVPSPAEKEQAMQLVRVGRAALTEHNHRAAQEFLAKNASVKGVVTTASGLQYQVFEAGDAKSAAPTEKDRVTVNYRGRLPDGTEFDNSDAHDQAATFTVGNVIKGWKEALLLMKRGAKWRLFVPPALAYDAYPPPTIPPGSLLIFDFELVKMDTPPAMGEIPRKRAPGAGTAGKAHAAPGTVAPVAVPPGR